METGSSTSADTSLAGTMLPGALGFYNRTRIQTVWKSDVYASQRMDKGIKTWVLQVKRETNVG